MPLSHAGPAQIEEVGERTPHSLASLTQHLALAPGRIVYDFFHPPEIGCVEQMETSRRKVYVGVGSGGVGSNSIQPYGGK